MPIFFSGDKETCGCGTRGRGTAACWRQGASVARRTAAKRRLWRRRRRLLASLASHRTVRGWSRGAAPARLRLRLSALRLSLSFLLLRRRRSSSDEFFLLLLLPPPPPPLRPAAGSFKNQNTNTQVPTREPLPQPGAGPAATSLRAEIGRAHV